VRCPACSHRFTYLVDAEGPVILDTGPNSLDAPANSVPPPSPDARRTPPPASQIPPIPIAKAPIPAAAILDIDIDTTPDILDDLVFEKQDNSGIRPRDSDADHLGRREEDEFRLPWYYFALRLVAHVWIAVCMIPSVVCAVLVIAMVLFAVLNLINGEGSAKLSAGAAVMGVVSSVIFPLITCISGLFLATWALAALVLLDMGEQTRRNGLKLNRSL